MTSACAALLEAALALAPLLTTHRERVEASMRPVVSIYAPPLPPWTQARLDADKAEQLDAATARFKAAVAACVAEGGNR